VGIDIGSSSIHYTALSGDGQLLYAGPSLIHFANPLDSLNEAWVDICSHLEVSRIISTAFTGNGAEVFPQVIPAVIYVHDSVAIPKGAALVDSSARYILHIGAKDAYFFDIRSMGNRVIIQEWRTGTKCGGGSGTLIEKQCRRLFEGDVAQGKLEDTGSARTGSEAQAMRRRNRHTLQQRLEEMFRRAESEARRSTDPSEFLARCGVVIQSDLIHKQNEGATRIDNLAGLFRTVARNYTIDVLGARQLAQARAIATGGVMANDIVRENLASFLGIPIERPANYADIAAIGAAIKAIEENNHFTFDPHQLDKVAEHSRERRKLAPSLRSSLSDVKEINEPIDVQIPAGTEVILGIDGGSTTTKGALVDLKTGRLLDKLYIKTHGNPEESLKRVLRYLARHKDNVIVKGVGATGSARKLYEKILLSKKRIRELVDQGVAVVDRITDEITCHALGVKQYDAAIDTIFEVGGQDMKFTSFAPDGTVREAKMNYSCQAGSGQTLENMADVIGLQVEDSLQEAALRAESVPIIDSTCGVFMEMDENRLIAEGFPKDQIAAAIVRGTAASYYFKFVGGAQHVGRKCSAQGGPALGKAFLTAMAHVTGREIQAYPHREMFGAWGQALDIIENIKQLHAQGRRCDSAFRGWAIVDMPFSKRRVSCRELFADKSCGVRDCQLEVFAIEDDEIVTGGFCPRGNSEVVCKPTTDYVRKYHQIYDKHFKHHGCMLAEVKSAKVTGRTVGIKRSTATLGEKGIWSAALLRKLGFYPVVSPVSDRDIAKVGVDRSRTEFCIARKVVTGHAALLSEHPAIEYLFNPSFIEQRRPKPPDLKYCIYTESEGYVLNDVLSLDKRKQINPILHFGDRPLLVRELRREFARIGFSFTTRQLKDALAQADLAEHEFKNELYSEGDKFLWRIETAGTRAYVGIGRDYVLLDPEASSNSGAMFSQVRGLEYIPQIYLEHRFMDVAIDSFVANEFWVESVKILKANVFVADHPNLFAIRMINFACGPDSLKLYQEQRIHQAANKPVLVLLTDAQTNNAPFVTRTEAHERVVNQCTPIRLNLARLKGGSTDSSAGRTWLIPYMGDSSYVAAAGLRHFGINGEVLPTNTQLGYEIARKHIYTEVCHPLKGVVGDAIGLLKEQIAKHGKAYVEDNFLVMLPTTSGPCRFGKYTEVLRGFMDEEGLQKVPVVGPSSETDYIDIPLPPDASSSAKMKMQQSLFKAILAADLLDDILRRFRPYARDKIAVERLKEERLRELEGIAERGCRTRDLLKWAKETVSAFDSELRSQKSQLERRFPLVMYIGEIYMRQHDPYTNFVIKQLEDSGLEVVRDPITDWLLYVNRMNLRNAKRDIRLGLADLNLGRVAAQSRRFLKSLLKRKYMVYVEHKIAQPFHEVLAGRHVLPEPLEMIETLEREHIWHGNIEGESPLSIAIAYYFMNDLLRTPSSEPRTPETHDAPRVAGIFHVGPFTCMQEGVATAKIEAMAKELRKKKPDLVFPIVHAFFGDSPSANLDSEIAVFREQCYQKQDLLAHGKSQRAQGEGGTPSSGIVDVPRRTREEHAPSRL
jgi:activator of 2-hydroxyglutaryl-CoA dehydratase/predicted nucleotide-binding protein (sugar kinase/HSP70/actin superfamily)